MLLRTGGEAETSRSASSSDIMEVVDSANSGTATTAIVSENFKGS